ncbi:hypothetical protein CSE16_08730 [Solibacillus sp. R5-41]|uniref:hypothetical protein n=1 Tax=Solibacillus sp. R5-41 TaxID=2048654 RepID=UPI000C126B57|nr:hypothetical protein [Solibacillus sp. R5-41]ATP40129.1 hypothetical protein CSE16_08730 [Solibacillus sp. R5-41]
MEGDFISSNNSSNQVTQVTETQVSDESSSQVPQFPSGQVLLETIQHEYDIETSRKRDLENRAGVLIALSGALIGFYANTLDYSFAKEASTPFEYIAVVFLVLVYLLPLITLLTALWNFLKILDAKSYDRLRLDGFKIEVGKKASDSVSMDLAINYKDVVLGNHNVNEEKAKQLNKGIKLMYFSLIIVVFVYFLQNILKQVI